MRTAPLLCLLLLACTSLLHAEPESASTQVYVMDGELVYAGNIDEKANQRLFALYASLRDKPKTLSIQSGGGNVILGMALGNWVRVHKLDVKVMEYCLSSCANYVFPAGARKIVSNFAVIGYHGGANSSYLRLAAATEKALSVQPRSQVFKDIAATMLKDVRDAAQRESAYFEALGVRADLVSLGQEERYQALVTKPNVVGWTYSIDDFARLGVRDIVVINPPWLPTIFAAERQVFSVLSLE